MNGRCIMMCSGEFHPMNIDRKPQDFVIAVDGGLRYLMECGIEPDFLMGDFDSLGEDFADIVAKYRGMGEEHFLQLPVVKDDTDTMAAARLGIQRGYKEFLMYGAMGGRLDHTIANIQTMVWILRNGGRAFILDGDTRVTVFEGTVSLFALDRSLSDVTIKGMKYEIENAAVPNDYPVGCSNETLPQSGSKGAYYSIGEGTGLLVMTEKLLNPHR